MHAHGLAASYLTTMRPLAVALLLMLCSGGLTRAQKFYQCEPGETPDLKVWAAESKQEADWLVYFVYDGQGLGQPGIVMQVPTRKEAQFSLSFVDDKKEAQVSLWIVDTPQEAGWQHPEKAPIVEALTEKKP